LDFPIPLQQRVINALKADPKTVDLRAQAAHFYALGARIMELFDDRAVLDTLLDVSILNRDCLFLLQMLWSNRSNFVLM
jgi:hypothetical protein